MLTSDSASLREGSIGAASDSMAMDDETNALIRQVQQVCGVEAEHQAQLRASAATLRALPADDPEWNATFRRFFRAELAKLLPPKPPAALDTPPPSPDVEDRPAARTESIAVSTENRKSKRARPQTGRR